MTKCDKYWWHVNKKIVCALFLALPLTIINPLGVIIFPLILSLSGERFLSLQMISENIEDSYRLILSLPFSRKEIFDTYFKMPMLMSLLYLMGFELIVNMLFIINFKMAPLINFSISFSTNLGSLNSLTFNFFVMFMVLFSNLFLLLKVNRYCVSKANNIRKIFIISVLAISIFYLFIGYFVRQIVFVLNGNPSLFSIDIDYSNPSAVERLLNDYNMRIIPVEYTYHLVAIIIHVLIILVLLLLLLMIVNRERKNFLRGQNSKILIIVNPELRNTSKAKGLKVLKCPSCDSFIMLKHLQVFAKDFECEKCGARIINKNHYVKIGLFYIALSILFFLKIMSKNIFGIEIIVGVFLIVYIIILFFNNFKQEGKDSC